MARPPEAVQPVSWWCESTKVQWLVYVPSWLGWTLEPFDFTTFLLLITALISQYFRVLLTVA